jgi:hypothetical protein
VIESNNSKFAIRLTSLNQLFLELQIYSSINLYNNDVNFSCFKFFLGWYSSSMLETRILFDEMGVRISNLIPAIMLISTELVCLE